MSKEKPDSDSAEWSFSKPAQRIRWPYNKWFGAHIRKRIRYDFVRERWNRSIAGMVTIERLTLEEREPSAVKLSDTDRRTLAHIDEAGVPELMTFLDRVDSQETAAAFCTTARVPPADLLDLLRKLYKYLPFGAQMRQLVADDDERFQEYVDRLVAHKLGYSLALLDIGRTRKGRDRLTKETGIPKAALLDLVKRADLSRLKLMSGGMIRHSWAIGYKGLDALQKATPTQYAKRVDAYYKKTAKGTPFDLTASNVEGHIARMKLASKMLEL